MGVCSASSTKLLIDDEQWLPNKRRMRTAKDARRGDVESPILGLGHRLPAWRREHKTYKLIK